MLAQMALVAVLCALQLLASPWSGRSGFAQAQHPPTPFPQCKPSQADEAKEGKPESSWSAPLFFQVSSSESAGGALGMPCVRALRAAPALYMWRRGRWPATAHAQPAHWLAAPCPSRHVMPCHAALPLLCAAAGFGLTVGYTEMDSVVVLETTQAVNRFLEKQVRSVQLQNCS